MISDRQLKQLAESTIKDGQADNKVARFVTSKLPARELKTYLFYLRQALRNSRVKVSVAGELTAGQKRTLAARFHGRQVEFAEAPALGGGLEIEFEDSVMKMNIRNMIERTVERLKETL